MAQTRNTESDRRAAENDDQSAQAVTLQAKVEQLRGEAVQNFATAERLGLDNPEMWLAYGRMLESEQKYAQAETYLRRATVDKPDMPDAHYELGLVDDHLNKYADAIGQYQATLALRADDPPTLERLALLYATSANPDLRSPKMAIQLGIRANDAASQQNARYMDTLARCYASDGNFLEALNWEDRAIKRAEQIRDKSLLRELQPRHDLFVQHKTE
jgi:tetratricopeptide (TPR) repeat protein